MKQTLALMSVVSVGAFLGTQAALAQAPGGMPAQTPSTFPGRTTPGQTPGMNGTIPNDSAQSKVDDKKFVKDAAIAGMTEVEIGKLAAEKSSRDDIKEFGKKIVDDHTKANDQLKQLASKEKVSIPDALDSKHQSQVDKLSKLSGEQFDKAFLKDQIKDHQSAIRNFNAEAQGGSDANVKTFASNILPTLEQHLEMVKGLNKGEKNSADRQAKGQ